MVKIRLHKKDIDIATNTNAAAIRIAQYLNIENDLAIKIVQGFISQIIRCVEMEVPFNMQGLGKFYFKYKNKPFNNGFEYSKAFYKGKVIKTLTFSPNTAIRKKLCGWVHDLGIKNNKDYAELSRVSLKPEEIKRVRRAKMLQEQFDAGFRPDLIFDDDKIHKTDEEDMKQKGDPPKMSEIVKRLGIELDLNNDDEQ